MGDMLSQAEIDALLNGTSAFDFNDVTVDEYEDLSPQEIDALGEIGNISMGTSATTLFTLLGQKVSITTPKVTITNWREICQEYAEPSVAVRVEYTDGIKGTNLLIIKERDVKVITDLMMGGMGVSTSSDLNDLHLSAIGEAMNQMIGSSATSMSSMFDKRIEISPPKAFVLSFNSNTPFDGDNDQRLVKVAFKMEIGDLIDSEIMQLIPIKFAKQLVDNLLNADIKGFSNDPFDNKQIVDKTPKISAEQYKPNQQEEIEQGYYQQQQNQQQQNQQQQNQQQQNQQQQNQQEANNYQRGNDNIIHNSTTRRDSINIQPAHFQTFDESRLINERKNISLIMDVPLQVTVELGRTHKLIKDVLEFGPGSIVELDKLAGEPVDILVNGKAIAKGEVVVIDESFGIRITDIIHPSKRI